MLGNNFRPWGHLSWILGKISPVKWSVLGCLSPEERCISTLELIKLFDSLYQPFFIKVIDPPSRFSAEADTLIEKRIERFIALVGNPNFIEDHELFQQHYKIVSSVEKFVKTSNGNVLIDISSFPKRFFFPVLKLLLTRHKSEIENLIVTYTVPKEYCPGALAEDPESWAPLPLFGPQDPPGRSVEVLFIGIGFLPLNLPELLKEYTDIKVRLFFPFPPGPPGYQRNWEFVRKVEEAFPPHSSSRKIERINTYDVSDAFEFICKETNAGNRKAIFAPYGPKPMSMAMCIYASLTNSEVYYTQPRSYNPKYCTGVKTVGAFPETYAYCLKLNGKEYYSIN